MKTLTQADTKDFWIRFQYQNDPLYRQLNPLGLKTNDIVCLRPIGMAQSSYREYLSILEKWAAQKGFL